MSDVYSQPFHRYHQQQQQQQQQPPQSMSYVAHHHQQHSPPMPPTDPASPDEPAAHVTPTPPQPSTPTSRSDQQSSKPEGKPQATFLTKLYALLERPENQHMIRWDAEGKHIIVERPEQLALHVLPSIYRQSRFASFSRQLNIYGFMRKVNLRNVDPSIDDPDASTWSHPTLDRNSPPEVVANFKRRVPPRLPKPRKRPDAMGDPNNPMLQPRSAVGLSVPLTVPSSVSVPTASSGLFQRGRSRGFSAPTPFNAGWSSTYPPRQALPPLTVPSESPPPHLAHAVYGNSHSGIPPITPTEDTPQNSTFSPSGYSASSSSTFSGYTPPSANTGSHPYGYGQSDANTSWNFPPLNPNSTSGSHSNLSSLLNPSSNYGRPSSIQTSYSTHQSYSSTPLGNNQSPVSMSPDSRPTTGYSVASSMSSMTYDAGHGEYDSRPGSSHHGRPITPIRGHSPTMKSAYPSGLSIRRERRHSHAVSPYPSPYESLDGRPMTAPGHPDSPPSTQGSIPRVKSLMHVSSTGGPGAQDSSYGYQPAHAEFAYSAGPEADRSWIAPGQEHNNGSSHSIRPSTSTSSLSAASQSSASATHTPPAIMEGGQYQDAEINRFLNQSRPNSVSSAHME